MGAAERIIEVVSDLPPQDRLRLVVDVGDEDPFAKLERIERGLASGELPLGIPHQQLGYWFSADQKTPVAMPTWEPTGALLPRIGKTLDDGGVLLLLVPIDYVWFPLSERGVYTYAHSSGLSRGEVWRFVPSAHPWAIEYVASTLDPLSCEDVRQRYGPEAAQRARRDAQSIEIQVRRA